MWDPGPEDMEDQKFTNLKFVESMPAAAAVWAVLTVENPYVSGSKAKASAQIYAGREKSHGCGDRRKAEELMTWTQSVEYEPVYNLGETMMECFARLSRIEVLSKQLPGLDLRSCGAPSCKALAEDIARGAAKEEDCVYIMKERIRRLMEQEKEDKRESKKNFWTVENFR